MAADLLPKLDYRFGWRWLLPIRDDDRLILSGFPENEKVFLRNELSPTSRFTNSMTEASAWIINAEDNGRAPVVTAQEYSRLNAVCVVGSRKIVNKWREALSKEFPFLYEYGFLPADNPRVIIPLEDSQKTISALRLHRPGRRLARMGLLLMRVLASLGLNALLRRRTLCIAIRGQTRVPMGVVKTGLGTRLPEAKWEFALYLGTPDKKRKTVILPLTDPIKVVLKTAASPDARKALMSELSTLRTLASTSLSVNIPKVLDVVECGDTLTLFLEYRQRESIRPIGYREAIVDLLVSLSAQDRNSQVLSNLLEKGWSECGAWQNGNDRRVYSAVIRKLEQAAAKGKMLWVNRSHGDFAPWNCSWTKEGLFVFDWEESRKDMLAFGDCFYFVVAPAVLVFKRPNFTKISNEALGLAAEVAEKTGLPVEDLRIYFAIWLLERASKHNDPLYVRLLTELERQW